MIHRNALLNLRSDLERGCRVFIATTSGSVVVTAINGVQDESHVVIDSNGCTVLVALDHISQITVLPPRADGTEPLYD